MAKPTTAFTKTSKTTTDFSKNQSYDDTRVIYDSGSRIYDDPNTYYDGVTPTLSPIGSKKATDFTKSSKNTTSVTVGNKNTTDFTKATKNTTSWTE